MPAAADQNPGDENGLLARIPEEEIVRRLEAVCLQTFQGHPHPPGTVLRPAAVLVPLLWCQEQWHLLYTRRTETVQSHKGQVSFPGGAVDPEDRSPEETALREAHEEIGLAPGDVRVLGRLPALATNSYYLVTPVVACIRWPYPFNPSPKEVSRVFTMPLAWLGNRSHWEERRRTNRLGYEEDVVYYQCYDGETLWGVTGRITVEFLQILSAGF